MDNPHLNAIYPRSRTLVPVEVWDASVVSAGLSTAPDLLFDLLRASSVPLPRHLGELLRIEYRYWSVRNQAASIPVTVDALTLNPTVSVEQTGWNGLPWLFQPHADGTQVPTEHPEMLILWFDPRKNAVRIRTVTNNDLLALKIAAENISPEAAAIAGGVPVPVMESLIEAAVQEGLLLAPASKLKRDATLFRTSRQSDAEYLVADSFSLQWHITQVCDLHCKHCYDRSDRSPLTFEQAIQVLDGLKQFCRDRRVRGAVSFTGGNPLLHPRFLDIYRAAADRGFGTAILGNPAPRERIHDIIDIQMPSFFQISIEGLREHNDSIRGSGHFDRAIAFLDVLRGLGVYAMVMLTLTRDNLDQVVPLAEVLRDHADVFHFNRLALFGEGANLAMPDRKNYRRFLEAYLAAAETNPVMGIKDNLFNLLRREKGAELFGGCAGYGCGAAFNFVSLLADGEVHACRKLPSRIGNIYQRTFAEVYDSEEARRYRLGPAACRECDIRPACGGCLASSLSHGLDIFTERDPFCFKEQG